MELNKIEKLISKYLDAETSIKEEKLLKKYFSEEDVPLHLKEYQIMFTYFSNSDKDKSTKKISLPHEKRKINWLSAVAIAVIFISIFSFHQKNVNERKEAMLAYNETQRALQMISFNLNKGNRAVSQLDTFEKTQYKIFKNNNTK